MAGLRLEFDADDEPARRAAISHELARIHERSLDTAAAARDALAATHEAAGFIEPLESLIRIALERRSRANLTKLLERLFRVSRTPAERGRAAIELLGHYFEADELSKADELLRDLETDDADAAAVWLARAWVASRTGDVEALLAAWLGRASTARSSEYRAQLLEAAGRLTIEREQIDEGLALLQQAFDEVPHFARLERLERAARLHGRPGVARAAAEALADLFERSQSDSEEAERNGLTASSQAADAPAEARLRAALHAAENDEIADALAAVLGLLAERPHDLFLVALAERLALRGGLGEEHIGDHVRRLRGALEASESSADAGVLHLDLALALAVGSGRGSSGGGNRGDASGAASSFRDFEAARLHLEAALQAFPGDFLATLLLVVAAVRRNEAGTASQLLLSLGESWPQATKQSLLVAGSLLLSSSDPKGAVRALEAARDAGASSRFTRRLLRIIALLSGEAALVLAADLTLLDGEGATERAWEALRLAYLSDNGGAIERILSTLPQDAPARSLARLLLLPTATSGTEGDGMTSRGVIDRAVRLLGAARLYQDEPSRAEEVLQLDATQDGRDLVVTTALVVHLEAKQPERAARFLRATAEAVEAKDADLAQAWFVRATVDFARAGRTIDALDCLRRAGAPGSTLLGAAERYLLEALGHAATERLEAFFANSAIASISFFALEAAVRALPTDRALARSLLAHEDAGLGIAARAGRTLSVLLDVVAGRLEAVEEASALEYFSVDELNALHFGATRATGSDSLQLDSARLWVEAAANQKKNPTSQLDGALLLGALAQRLDAPEEQRVAWRALARILDEPALLAEALDDDDEVPSGDDRKRDDALPLTAETAWARLEAAPPGRPGARTLARAKLADALRSAEPSDPDVVTLDLLSAFELLSGGDSSGALAALLALEESSPELAGDTTLLLGLSTAARRAGRADVEVRTLESLAEKCNDDQRAAALWERTGELWEGPLSDPARAETAFSAALSRNPSNTSAFVRVYRLVRARADLPRLLELIDARLDVLLDPEMRVELLWEKGRLCRTLGRRASALRALEHVLEINPEHLPALSLSAEMHLVDERFERAAAALRAIALHADTPSEVVARAGLHAVDLLERLHRPREAVQLLGQLEQLGVERGSILERRARNAARAEDWDLAYRTFGELSEGADDAELRLEGARMMLAIQRDHLKDTESLVDAARRVLDEAPADDDAIDVLLDAEQATELRTRYLRAPAERARDAIRAAPQLTARLGRVVDLAEGAELTGLARVALGTFALTGVLSEGRKRRLEDWANLPFEPHTAFTTQELDAIASPREAGVAGELARTLSPLLAVLTQPTLESLGVTALSRIDPFAEHPLRTYLGPWMRLLGIADFELYWGGNDPQRVLCFAGDLPTLVIGEAVLFPFSSRDRARLVSAVFGAARGLGALAALSNGEAELWLGALGVAVGRRMETVFEADLDERARALGQLIPRDLRERMAAQFDSLIQAGRDPSDVVSAVRASAARVACVVHGDPSILRYLPRLVPEDAEKRRQLLAEVVSFAFSEEFAELRRGLGGPLP